MPSRYPRRAYCTHADALWPPIWIMLSACLLELTTLPLLLVVPMLVMGFLGGVWVFAIVLSGQLKSRRAFGLLKGEVWNCMTYMRQSDHAACDE